MNIDLINSYVISLYLIQMAEALYPVMGALH